MVVDTINRIDQPRRLAAFCKRNGTGESPGASYEAVASGNDRPAADYLKKIAKHCFFTTAEQSAPRTETADVVMVEKNRIGDLSGRLWQGATDSNTSAVAVGYSRTYALPEPH